MKSLIVGIHTVVEPTAQLVDVVYKCTLLGSRLFSCLVIRVAPTSRARIGLIFVNRRHPRLHISVRGCRVRCLKATPVHGRLCCVRSTFRNSTPPVLCPSTRRYPPLGWWSDSIPGRRPTSVTFVSLSSFSPPDQLCPPLMSP